MVGGHDREGERERKEEEEETYHKDPATDRGRQPDAVSLPPPPPMAAEAVCRYGIGHLEKIVPKGFFIWERADTFTAD